MKKLIAVLLALSIVFTVPCMAFAASEPYFLPTPEITIRTLLATLSVYPVVLPVLLFETLFLSDSPYPNEASDAVLEFSLSIWNQLPLPESFDKQLLI